ncbi:undecaprenyl-phosphate glucose phosphotransferase [Tardiphaga sp.]|jgi:Undecaprenyl-phosphate glucose phosphotransferase|uniref:undecaprenyl-phosphate glucose phosphotransferase n=1 Tax=Tardiphaga sp. TaxID=1926292 RepID=UPI0037DA22A0
MAKRATRSGKKSEQGIADRIGIPKSLDIVSPFVALFDLAWISALALLTGAIYDAQLVANINEVKGTLGSGFAVAMVYSAFAHGAKLYRSPELLQVNWQIGRSVLVWLAAFACLAGLVFLLKSGATFSRGWVVIYMISGIGVTVMVRVLVAAVCAHIIRSRWLRPNRVVIVGLKDELVSNEALSQLDLYGHDVVAIVELTAGPDRLLDADLLKARMHELVATARQADADEVVVAMPWDFLEAIAQIEHELQVLPIPVRLVADTKVVRLLDGPLTEFGTTKTVQLQRPPLSKAQLMLKQLIDQVLAAAGLVVLLPVFVIIGIAIRWESPGKPLFLQNRMGFNGRPFKIYKFRTMRASDNGPIVVQATKNDARITQIGALLRKLSIDEVPQLINVLRGEMSLVGPRPHALAHDSEYAQRIATYALRHKIKPGITGWAQVNGFRGETPQIEMMQQRVESDLWYIESWSLWLDIRILALTVIRLMKTDNVY